LSQSLIQDDLVLKDRNVVVIDVLRASSTILTALVNGAKEIIPAESVSVAARISKGLGNSILCGERNGKVIEGFKMGNSPFEFTSEAVTGKILIFSTTNGTLSITKSKFAKNCVIAGFMNLNTVANYLAELDEDFTIVCSGKLNDFCIEDAVAAGMLIARLNELKGKSNYQLLDSGYISYKLAKLLAYKSTKPDKAKILNMLKDCEHGKYLASLGFEEDLKYCSELDKYDKLPFYKNNVLKLKETFESEANEKSKMKRVNISNKLHSGNKE
jgi:2-phosphosulfolactate phosphatase